MTSDLSSTIWPAVSIVIPVRNEVASIGAAIESCLDQEYPGAVEVVVADGMSDDGTRAVVMEMSRPNVTLVDNPKGLTPSGLNVAIAASSGRVVVRCDAHSRLPPGYLRRAVEIMTETGADNVGGVQKAVGQNLFGRVVALAMSSRIGVGDAKFHYGGPAGETDTVYLGVFRRDTLDEVGLFDESLVRNQDYELNHRIRAAGGKVYFHPDLSVDYAPRDSLKGLWRQYYQYGYWKYRVVRRHPDSLRLRQVAPPLLVIGLIGSGVLAVFGRTLLASLVPAAWLVALVSASVVVGIKRREWAAIALPPVVASMHLAWGIGFLGAAIRRRT